MIACGVIVTCARDVLIRGVFVACAYARGVCSFSWCARVFVLVVYSWCVVCDRGVIVVCARGVLVV